MTTNVPKPPRIREYAGVGGVFCALAVVLSALTSGTHDAARPAELLRPVFALVALTATVWAAMVVVRNASVMLGKASVRYYHSYASDVPDERIERPARTFNNLMQVPTLFYAACGLMIVTGKFDAAQVNLAWFFVVTRVVHAIVYMGFNYVPLRFAAYVSGCVTLGVMWVRFAEQSGAFG